MAAQNRANVTARTVIEAKRMEGQTAMNRWMKRRIERSRERCDRAEVQKRPQVYADKHESDQTKLVDAFGSITRLTSTVEKLT